MRRRTRMALATLLSLVAVVAVSACGSSSNSSSKTSAKASTSTPASTTATPGATGTVQMLQGTAPQSLDPGLDYTTQGSEVNWIVYTGLTTYAHASGTAGAQLIPGLATALPTISDGGKTYTATLRKNLVFSNGSPVKASDFTYTVERAIKIPWGGSGSFITPNIVGAAAYAAGKAKTISGITTNDATGQIVVHLTAAYGPFDNVLAFPSLGLIPAGTPLKAEPTSPPPGVGPYEVTNIVPNQSYDVVKNPHWASMGITDIPAGHDNVDVKISSNITSNALAVLNNSADIFDWADTIPGSLISQIQSQAASRYKSVNLGGSTYYIFLNTTEKPFSSQLAREAVVTGLNQDAMSRLGSGTLEPACFFLPPDVPGHPTGPCPYGTPGLGNLAKAKALVKQSGMAGQPVTVWSETRSPRQQWMTYYTQYLNSIGFKATQKVIADATYFTTVGESKTLHPQTGFTDWNQDFPNPYDFYGPLLDGKSILPTDNENQGQINDPYINAQVTKLGATPTTDLSSVASQWQALDEYVAKKAYVAVFGYQKFPFFASTRMNYGALVFQPIYGWDLTSFELK
ncbi:MAG TPA: ABC transporter substrate-binding protein [Solirubrobacteraceae bacterium]|nr:ABC transporter substrate-binding protein [Solirubrobacteraceae bacterium]